MQAMALLTLIANWCSYNSGSNVHPYSRADINKCRMELAQCLGMDAKTGEFRPFPDNDLKPLIKCTLRQKIPE
jgi:hypothetical protein